MRVTTVDRSNLARFGCTFSVRQNLVFISWQEERRHQVVAANIIGSLVCATGPLLCLAFEVSPTKALPHYCFFPFDLTNKSHRHYLSNISKEGKINLCFLAGSHRIKRTLEIPPKRRERMVELCSSAITDLEKFPSQQYDVDRAITDFEQNVRLVDYFQYVVTDSELQRVIASSNEKAAKVAPEDRAQAAKIASELLEVFRPQYESFDREFIKKIPSLRRNSLFCLDLQEQFEGDYDGFAQFLADIIAVHTPKEETRQLETAALLAKSIFGLMDHMKEASSENGNTSSAQLEADFRDVMTRLAGGRGLSVKAVTNLLSGIGVPLGGQPGRTPKDYSSEYALKASGQTWSAIAARILEKDPETHEEFGGLGYDALTFEQKELLKHRVREGVRSYAKRTGRPFPPREEQTKLPPPNGQQ